MSRNNYQNHTCFCKICKIISQKLKQIMAEGTKKNILSKNVQVTLNFIKNTDIIKVMRLNSCILDIINLTYKV